MHSTQSRTLQWSHGFPPLRLINPGDLFPGSRSSDLGDFFEPLGARRLDSGDKFQLSTAMDYKQSYLVGGVRFDVDPTYELESSILLGEGSFGSGTDAVVVGLVWSVCLGLFVVACCVCFCLRGFQWSAGSC